MSHMGKAPRWSLEGLWVVPGPCWGGVMKKTKEESEERKRKTKEGEGRRTKTEEVLVVPSGHYYLFFRQFVGTSDLHNGFARILGSWD